MLSELLNFDSWVAPNTEELKNKKTPPKSKKRPIGWKHFKKELSPVDLYKYLKARFGPPNGIAMLTKTDTADNVIHWHYTIAVSFMYIHFWGNAGGLEISLHDLDNELSPVDRVTFINALKSDFGKYGKQMSKVQQDFESWSLFVNPYVRLYQTIESLMEELEGLDLEEVEVVAPDGTPDDYNRYKKKMKVWTANVSRAAALGTTLRMLFPVLLESFINMVIYTYRRDEYKEDERLYDQRIREHIDIRVKTLHINCKGFERPVDSNDQRFKDFQTLMNSRNDFLHGNIEPSRLKVLTMFFDDKFTPLYQEDEGIITRMMSRYCDGVSRKQVLHDQQVVSNFIEMVLDCMDSEELQFVTRLMSERFPGYNQKERRLGILLPAQYVETNFFYERKIEQDSEFQLYIDESGRFQLYLPVSWKTWVKDGLHYFASHESQKADLLIFSLTEIAPEALAKLKQNLKDFPRMEFNKNEFCILPPKVLEQTVNFPYFQVYGNQIAQFTFTRPAEPTDGEEAPMPTPVTNEMMKILGSFGIIAAEDREREIQHYRFNRFIKGIAASQLLLVRAVENKAFFEAMNLSKNQIDAMLRVGILLKKQIINNTDEIDITLISQDEDQPTIPFAAICIEALQLEVIEAPLYEQLLGIEQKMRFMLDNFILSSLALTDVEKYAAFLYGIGQELHDIVAGLEKEQEEKGVGPKFIKKDGDQNFFYNYIKGKMGLQTYFDN